MYNDLLIYDLIELPYVSYKSISCIHYFGGYIYLEANIIPTVYPIIFLYKGSLLYDYGIIPYLALYIASVSSY